MAEHITRTSFYEKAERQAKKIAVNSLAALGVVAEALKKSERLGKGIRKIEELQENLKIFSRMLKAHYRGEYKKIPWSTIVKMLTAILYFLFITDFIPDFIPMFGLLDDATVFMWVVASIRDDMDKFEEWERQQKGVPKKKQAPQPEKAAAGEQS